MARHRKLLLLELFCNKDFLGETHIRSLQSISIMSSAGKESTCKAGNLGSIPGLGRSPGEGKDYPLQYSGLENSMDCIVHGVSKNWTQLSCFHLYGLSFVAQLVKNLPAMWETWFWFMGWEDPLWRRKWLPTPVFLPGEFHEERSLVGYNPRGRTMSGTQLSD